MTRQAPRRRLHHGRCSHPPYLCHQSRGSAQPAGPSTRPCGLRRIQATEWRLVVDRLAIVKHRACFVHRLRRSPSSSRGGPGGLSRRAGFAGSMARPQAELCGLAARNFRKEPGGEEPQQVPCTLRRQRRVVGPASLASVPTWHEICGCPYNGGRFPLPSPPSEVPNPDPCAPPGNSREARCCARGRHLWGEEWHRCCGDGS